MRGERTSAHKARRARWLLVVMAGLLTIPSLAGCRAKAPRIEFANRRYSAALRTAANTKSRERLTLAEGLIDRDHAAGQIGPDEYASYRSIIGLAEAGRWEAAEAEALRFRGDQRR